jgi:xanthine dehydrogenase accessory factor
VNNPRAFWEQVLARVRADDPCALLCVVDSEGSSPGRKGFKMCVPHGSGMFGSIGGGSMEHKLVELVRSHMSASAGSPAGDPAGSLYPLLKRQIHQADIGKDRSGMICSGEQTVAFFFLFGVEHQHLVEGILAAFDDPTKALDLEMSSTGLRIVPTGHDPTARELSWSFREPLRSQPRVAIVGAGHVSLALSRLMEQLGFRVEIYDDRPWLNTWHANTFAQRTVVEHARIAEHLPEDPELFVVLASFGYRTDDIVLRQLVRNRYRYIGMLGSAEKVRVMFEAMRRDGFTEEELARVHAPIGLPIHSKTPEEIAVSIAAEIIRVKNG